MIKKYIKKPIPVEAVQWRGSNYTKDQIDWIFQNANVRFAEKDPATLIIRTLEGDMKACPGDYIVKGIDGEYYPVKKEIFEKTYVEAKEDDEFIQVRKDRLEKLIDEAYDYAWEMGRCPIWLYCNRCLCRGCKFEYNADYDDHTPTKALIEWLEGEENE